MIALLLRLYPTRWRARYGDEFAALLAERPLGPFDVADVLLGALDAHLHLRGLGSWSDHRRGSPMSLRIGGLAALAGGSLMLISFLAAQVRSDLGNLLLFVGFGAVLVALAGLSASLSRTHPALAWTAFLVPATGIGVATLGALIEVAMPGRALAGILTGWHLFFVGFLTSIAGSALFALASLRSTSLPRPGVLALLTGSAFTLLWVAVSIVANVAAPAPLAFVLQLGPLTFPIGWVALGVLSVRAYHGDPRPTVA